MSAIGRTIAAAMVSDMNGATFSTTVTFTRNYVPKTDLETTASLVGTVVYAGQKATPDSRSAWDHGYDIDIGIQKKFASDAVTESDALTDLLDELADYWKTRKPTGTSARLTAVEYIHPYVPDHMTQYKQFTGVVRLTFRLVRTNS